MSSGKCPHALRRGFYKGLPALRYDGDDFGGGVLVDASFARDGEKLCRGEGCVFLRWPAQAFCAMQIYVRKPRAAAPSAWRSSLNEKYSDLLLYMRGNEVAALRCVASCNSCQSAAIVVMI